MTPKKRLTRRDPSYYVPLPFAMALKRVIPEEEMKSFLFNGMQLSLRVEGVIQQTIAVVAHYRQEDHVIGYIPKGMISRILGLIELEERIVVTLEKKQCDRLKRAFWICIDELPDLPELY